MREPLWNGAGQRSLLHEVLDEWLVFVLHKQRLSKIRLKCQLKRKNIDTSSLKRFSKFQPKRECVNIVNLSSFQLKIIFKFVIAWFAREKQNYWRHNHIYKLSCKHVSRPIIAQVMSYTMARTIIGQRGSIRAFGRDILISKKLFLELCGPSGRSFR